MSREPCKRTPLRYVGLAPNYTARSTTPSSSSSAALLHYYVIIGRVRLSLRNRHDCTMTQSTGGNSPRVLFLSDVAKASCPRWPLFAAIADKSSIAKRSTVYLRFFFHFFRSIKNGFWSVVMIGNFTGCEVHVRRFAPVCELKSRDVCICSLVFKGWQFFSCASRFGGSRNATGSRVCPDRVERPGYLRAYCRFQIDRCNISMFGILCPSSSTALTFGH